jgi:hypothetical protein
MSLNLFDVKKVHIQACFGFKDLVTQHYTPPLGGVVLF